MDAQGKRDRRKKLRAAIWALAVGLLLANAVFQPFVHLNIGRAVSAETAAGESIETILQKKSLSRGDYRQIFRRTGLGKAAVDELRKRGAQGDEEILRFRDIFLSSRTTECRGNFFTKQDVQRPEREENTAVPLAPLEDGDILLSFSSHTLGWKHGHAGLVTDAQKGLCLEAIMPGHGSKIKNVRHWRKCADFMILRLKGVSAEERKEIAVFARRNLQGVPYSLLSGLLDRREEEECCRVKAQCAYLIWYAFMQFGYDLDGDGGRLVTVEDLFRSPELEIVQVFGTDPAAAEKKRQRVSGQREKGRVHFRRK